MDNHLLSYLSQYVKLTKDEIEFVEKNSNVKNRKKGTVLLREGQISKNTFLVLEGCVKSYYLNDGDETITGFYTQKDLIIPAGYANQEPSPHYISCVGDCIISSGTKESTSRFLELHPRLAQICLQITNLQLAHHQLSYDSYRLLSPEARYQKFVADRPDLVNLIPQYMIANYLGIRPQSLSRIRKRLVNSKE